ncbi:hypothetical protein [Thiohalomonas denitrificans]|uniref:Uncharacterized protein n=1 Tax=Thiohalomonas denitrificans TaxID=415747 RepID=A0A1G5PT02_9GAMM|nr:hypothetical protein [Thiohalomonas denitrificans]SCZ52633.1 hypothetical protein SAMN03097708_00777 [Thiohalomonas denitrificans]
MSDHREELMRERLELAEQYRDYIAQNGFNYREYITPSPGSFTERYKRRSAAIDAVLAPELRDPGEEPEG